MEEVKISVILPIYNTEKYLRQCLESVIKQSLKEIEIICVNDGSTDSSLEILESLADQDARITILNQDNQGPGVARNLGLENASGEYLSFLDSDDFFEYDMLERTYLQAKREDSDVLVFRSNYFSNQDQEFQDTSWTIRAPGIPTRTPFHPAEISENIFLAFVGWPWDKLFKREFIQREGLEYQEMITSEDMYFVFMAIILAERISIHNAVFAHHRFDIEGSVSRSRDMYFENYLLGLDWIRRALSKRNLFEHYEPEFLTYFMHATLWNLETLSEPVADQLIQLLESQYFELFRFEKLQPYQILDLYEAEQFLAVFPQWKSQLIPDSEMTTNRKFEIQRKNYERAVGQITKLKSELVALKASNSESGKRRKGLFNFQR